MNEHGLALRQLRPLALRLAVPYQQMLKERGNIRCDAHRWVLSVMEIYRQLLARRAVKLTALIDLREY